jgi:two-component system sensor histidine kinase KdpD
MSRFALAIRVGVSLGVVALVTAVYDGLLHVNPTTVALTYVIVILLIATSWGIAEATVASLVAMLCFNFFFLPPVGTLTIADPQNWVALLAFLITGIVTSQLSGRVRQRSVVALARQRDLERLYALSRSLLLAEHEASVPGAIARHIAGAFELPSTGIYDQRSDTTSWAGAGDFPALDTRLREVARRSVSTSEAGMILTPIQLGGSPIGSVALPGSGLSDTVLQSIANLAAIGLERARAQEATARADAARESSELRATVLDALAHEFKTPLTSMKAASSDLLVSTAGSPRDHELVEIIDEDLDRFQGLVTDAVRMLRIDAGDFAVHPERESVADLVAAEIHKMARHLDGHRVARRIPAGLTIDADRDLMSLALRQLLDNAVKYSPPTSTIDVSAETNGSVAITVRNSGSVIPESERAHVFERFYRGTPRQIPGTGMGLAIVQRIAQAHGGHVSVSSSRADGTAFTINIPRGLHA